MSTITKTEPKPVAVTDRARGLVAKITALQRREDRRYAEECEREKEAERKEQRFSRVMTRLNRELAKHLRAIGVPESRWMDDVTGVAIDGQFFIWRHYTDRSDIYALAHPILPTA